MYDFYTSTALYIIEAKEFGIAEVTRTCRKTGKVTSIGTVDRILVVPDEKSETILEARRVCFFSKGRLLARTSPTGSDTYNKFSWGSWEEGRFPEEANLRSYNPSRHESPQDRVANLIFGAFNA